ncbi:MAG: ATP-binding protein [Pseudomonadota bacterium]
MRFGLRKQLLLIGLATLALPVASVGYIRATEQALRTTQAGYLANTARNVVPLIENATENLSTVTEAPVWFVEPLAREPVLDGFSADWDALTEPQPAHIGGSRLRVLAGELNGALFVHADVQHDPTQPVEFVVSCTTENGSLLLKRYEPQASGLFSAAPMQSEDAPVRGAWIPDAEGSQLELRIPTSPCRQRLGLWVNVAARLLSTHDGSVPGPMQRLDAPLSNALARHAVPGIEMFVISASLWRITPVVGQLPTGNTSNNDTTPSWAQRLFEPSSSQLPSAGSAFDQRTDWLSDLSSEDMISRRAIHATTMRLISEVVVPLRSGGAIVGGLVLRQPTDEILSLTSPQRTRMTVTVMGITLVIVLLLLAFATRLSLRVRRLSKAARTALDGRGHLKTELPGSRSMDEVGDVARDFESLLQQLETQRAWLQRLADNLSHELRTPIAVVRSSLDNLRHATEEPDREVLLDRAAGGVERLQATLLAMTRANRAEQATRDAEFSAVDLSALCHQLHAAYAATFPTHRFGGEIAPSVEITGNAELLVQMLDKLIENAVTFAPHDSEIELSVVADPLPTLRVFNHGSALPEDDYDRLFMPLVSRRHNAGEGHLGFGLYIARVIAQAHGASIRPRNEGSGVLFEVRFGAGTDHAARR